MKIGVKDKFWVLEEGDNRELINDEKEAINSLKKLMKENKEPALLEMEFKDKGQIEYRQVSWEKIAKELIGTEDETED